MHHSEGNRVYLVGPMGSGKTTLGRRAAEQLGMTFFDCDEEIERCCGVSVGRIFDIEGEAGFRQREHRMLTELSQQQDALIATGGGAITMADNRTLLESSGLVIWMKTSVSQQLRRLEQDRKRPLLQTPDRRTRLQELATLRDPFYGQVADLTFQSGRRNLKQVGLALAELIKKHQESPTNSP